MLKHNITDRTATMVDDTPARIKAVTYLITINPNYPLEQDDPEYEAMKRYIELKLNELFTVPNISRTLSVKGIVDPNTIEFNISSALEYGSTYHKLHSHTLLEIIVPKTGGSVSINYKDFGRVAREVFNLEHLHVDLAKFNSSYVNVLRYIQKYKVTYKFD